MLYYNMDQTVLLLSLVIAMAETSIITKPEDSFALVGSRVVFDCSTDLEFPMNWFHTPAGSNQSTEFYFLGGILQTHEFYKSGFHVGTSIESHYTLVIENVTARHAGRYDCYDNEGYGKIKVSADLIVLENSLECEPKNINSIVSSYTEITCNISMYGNLEPQLECEDDWHEKSSASVFGSYGRSDSGKHYLSTNASFPQTMERTHFTCSIRLNSQSPPLITKHFQVHSTDKTKTSMFVVIVILVLVVAVLIVVICTISVMIRRRYELRKLFLCDKREHCELPNQMTRDIMNGTSVSANSKPGHGRHDLSDNLFAKIE